MHPRNIFKEAPDYTALAIKYPEFRHLCELKLNGTVQLDFKKENALKVLTKTLLKEFLDLEVEFAPGSLIPTIPLRLNYILWLEDLLNKFHLTSNIQGIDIGCGSSCIYSLIAAKQYSWNMLALEARKESLLYAQENINRNHLNDKVRLYEQKNNTVIFQDLFDLSSTLNEKQIFDFCLCNPPFHDATNEGKKDKTRNPLKRPPPRNCPTGTKDELFCVGGEVAFVEQIINESFHFKEQIRIYTSMLGHKTSVAKIVKILNEKGVENLCTTEFVQGKTTRWGVAWTHCSDIDLQQMQP